MADPESLRRFCRWLLPLGYQRTTVMVAEWRQLWRILHRALGDLFDAPDLGADISRLRWQARLASWRAVAPLVRKRVATVTRGAGGPAATPLRWSLGGSVR